MLFNDYCIKLSTIFSSNNWLSDEFDNTSLEKAMRLGSKLTDEERELLIYLFNHYVQIPPSQYLKRILHVLNAVPTQSIEQIQELYIVPLKAANEIMLPKSSDFVIGFFKHPLVMSSRIFDNKKIKITSMKQLSAEIGESSDKKIMLVDDFSGSGDTIISCMDYITNMKKIPQEKVIVLLLACMKEGFARIKAMGYEIYCDYIQNKGISSIQNIKQRSDFTKLMNDIEKKYNIEEKWHFGYKESESLITLIRTPNNTFPVFWDSSKVENAPFKRN